MTAFCDAAWAETAMLREAIHALPFNRELAAGTLDGERFRFYMVQDALYLVEYSRALSVAAARAPDQPAMVRFAEAAREAVVVERALHESYFSRFGLDPAAAARAEPSPTCFGYTSFLLGTALTGTYEVLVAALLPCFWIYQDVGTAIAAESPPDNPYQAWVDTYADPEFAEAVAAVKAIGDQAAAATTDAGRAGMMRAFVRSTRYEWMFWDSAYRLETWPIV